MKIDLRISVKADLWGLEIEALTRPEAVSACGGAMRWDSNAGMAELEQKLGRNR